MRVPMGLKCAASYFQARIAMVVLVGLVYIVCEVYVDDILVHATSDEEFVERLKLVFERFRKYKLTINPDKTTLGMNETRFVGHHIDSSGIQFHEDKLTKVTNFPQPTAMKQLRSFLGLANYFRDHVQNHSIIAQPLQRMVDGYEKKNRFS